VCNEYQNHAYIDQFLYLIRLVSYCLNRLSHECPQEIVLPVDKAIKLIDANLSEQDVLHSEEAHEKPLEASFTDSVDLVLIALVVGIVATFVWTLLLLCISVCVVLGFQVKLALFDVFHADVLQ